MTYPFMHRFSIEHRHSRSGLQSVGGVRKGASLERNQYSLRFPQILHDYV